jgi:hypothetical protein
MQQTGVIFAPMLAMPCSTLLWLVGQSVFVLAQATLPMCGAGRFSVRWLRQGQGVHI